ncbi:MAG: trehalase family glycosidase [Eubacteriales bacterium]|nr:trehalase family glycosidase [Eubacteriales bacterium]MDD3881549.1 trehalase family glycosidase [Eubacteriales bacterium]MDD4513381.1 trehalase family glycosidase [Eubacteriales bacterium]
MSGLPNTSVSFSTADSKLKKLYNSAEEKCRGNVKSFDGTNVLVEGGGYEKIWLETQPMGGEMYAKRNLSVGLNNQLMFMLNQREDGRIPGSIALENGRVVPQFNKFQGFCLPAPALDMYYLAGENREYLELLKGCLEKFDSYLWKVRDSNGDGILESWCVYDTGEDNAVRYGDAPNAWTEETPPRNSSVVPMASMDFMSYSYSARKTLEEIYKITGDENSALGWRRKAEDVSGVIRNKLWDGERGACFDIDKTGKKIDVLSHNTLRCMYWGSISEGMADRFVREHLLNPNEFMTNMPMPSVSVSDKAFRNINTNNWSGQCEGLTYQRAIRALENYGWQRLYPLLAGKLFEAAGMEEVFTQQFDPFTMRPSVEINAETGKPKDAYGPTMLAVMEYISRLYGVHISRGTVHFGALGGAACRYEQIWNNRSYAVESDGKRVKILVGGKETGCYDCGQIIVTNLRGEKIREINL